MGHLWCRLKLGSYSSNQNWRTLYSLNAWVLAEILRWHWSRLFAFVLSFITASSSLSSGSCSLLDLEFMLYIFCNILICERKIRSPDCKLNILAFEERNILLHISDNILSFCTLTYNFPGRIWKTISLSLPFACCTLSVSSYV